MRLSLKICLVMVAVVATPVTLTAKTYKCEKAGYFKVDKLRVYEISKYPKYNWIESCQTQDNCEVYADDSFKNRYKLGAIRIFDAKSGVYNVNGYVDQCVIFKGDPLKDKKTSFLWDGW